VDWPSWRFTAAGITHHVYSRGEGADLLLLHELPGYTFECHALAEHLVAGGFRVHVPLLFGRARERAATINAIRRLYLSREIDLFATDITSPIVYWLRPLVRFLADRASQEGRRGRGVGVIGMCITGGFALALVTEPDTAGVVVCQPSLPLHLPLREDAASLGLSAGDLETASRRSENLPVPAILGVRFADDRWCPKERFDAIAERFGNAFEWHELPGSRHATLTDELVLENPAHPTRKALDRTIAFLRERLGEPAGSGAR
jgi:dienelactone hydrolase